MKLYSETFALAILLALNCCASPLPGRILPIGKATSVENSIPAVIPEKLSLGTAVSVCDESGQVELSKIDSVSPPAFEGGSWTSYLDTRCPKPIVAMVEGNIESCRPIAGFPDATQPSPLAKTKAELLHKNIRSIPEIRDSVPIGQIRCKQVLRTQVCYATKSNGDPGPVIVRSPMDSLAVLSEYCASTAFAIRTGKLQFFFAVDNHCGMGTPLFRALVFAEGNWKTAMEWEPD